MTSHLPCRFGAARLLSAALSLSLTATFLAAAPAATKRPVRKPVPPAKHPAVSPLTQIVAGRTDMPVQTLLVNDSQPAMGTHNAVRLWVRGDASGATLRVRVLAPTAAASPAADPLPRDVWISTPIPITFAGWREFVLPKDKFSLRSAPNRPRLMDTLLPAVAQPVSEMDLSRPDWAAATGLALEVTATKQTTLVVDDVAWTTLDAAGQGTDSLVVQDFEKGNIGAWQPVGTQEEQNAVSYGVTTLPAQVHGGRVAFRLTVTPPGLARQSSRKSVLQALAASGRPYQIWAPLSLFDPVLPTSLPPLAGLNADVTVTACAEQTQAATFCIYSPADLSDVTVSVPSDLAGPRKTLSKSLVDVEVVKVSPRSGSGSLRDADTAGLTPELLVKDDRAALSGPAPAVRLTGSAVCNIEADSSKQFWVTVTVPRNTPPGSYTGRLLVTGKGLPASSVRLSLTVLPLRLLSPAKQYGMDLRSRLDPAPAPLPSADGHNLVTDYVSPATLDAQLADLSAHGFTIASLYDSPDTLWTALDAYKAHGLGSSYNLYKGPGDPQTIESQRGAHTAPPLTYFTDPEPNDLARARMAPLAKAHLPNATYIPHQADYDALSSNSDIVVYSINSEYAQQLLRTKGQRLSMLHDWWYWPATDEDAKLNRVNAGYLLWRSGLYGAYLPDYQTAFGTDPYDESSAGAAPSKAAYRPLMLTYPVQNGVLDTVQWEACREGVTDVRYLTTMFAALRECKDNHVAPALVSSAETYIKTFLDKPLTTLPGGDYDVTRSKVADYAIKLRAAVDAYYKAHPVR